MIFLAVIPFLTILLEFLNPGKKFNKNISFGYVNSEHTNEELEKMTLYIEVAKKKYLAKVDLAPFPVL